MLINNFNQKFHLTNDQWKQRKFRETFISQNIRKFHGSLRLRTKTKYLFNEIIGYYDRNLSYNPDICSFDEYVRHWIVAHRGVIHNSILDTIEQQYGRLEGPLHIWPGYCSWDSKKDFPRPGQPQSMNSGVGNE